MSSRVAQVTKHVAPASSITGPFSPELLETTIHQHLVKQAIAAPDAPAIISHWQNITLTYRQLVDASDHLARLLLDAGVQVGDRVAICAGNCVEYVILFYAIIKIGAIAVVVNPSYTDTELLRAMRAAEPKLLFIQRTLGERSFEKHIALLEREYASLGLILVHESGYRDFVSRSPNATLTTADDPSLVINMQFTSGTTGAPKAAMLTHRNVLNNGRFIGDGMRLTPADKLCIPVPLFHCFGLVLGNMAALSHGASVVYPAEVFRARAVLEAVTRQRCTGVHAVPTMFIAMLELLDQEGPEGGFDLSCLRTGIAAGTIVNAQLMSRIQSKLSLPGLTIVYGQTETSPGSTMTTQDDPFDKRTSTVGKVMPHTTVKLCDDRGHTVPRGTAGEVWVSGYLVHAGYWRDEAASEKTLRRDRATGQVWLKSGDLGIMDHEGYLRISGRIKDLIVRGGENISPAEVENILAAHDDILDVSVVAVEDDKYGEVPCAIIIRRPHVETAMTKESVRAYAKAKMAHYKVPQHVLFLGDQGLPQDFPKTASGKIQKFILRDLAHKILKPVSS
ncbi:hypothetical protein PYCC9005_002856 [Savitreella phatthalungensis]